MPELIDVQVDTRATTLADPAWVDVGPVVEAQRRLKPLVGETDATTPVPDDVAGLGDLPTRPIDVTALAAAWTRVAVWAHRGLGPGDIVFRPTCVSTSTAVTVTAVRHLLRRRLRDERIAGLQPARRELYKRIRALRKEVAREDFDIDAAIREFREDG